MKAVNSANIRDYFNLHSQTSAKWKKRNRYYHKSLERYYKFHIPRGSKVLEIGCGTGDLLNAVEPSYGTGIDFSEKAIETASGKYPHLKFICDDIENLNFESVFDYIIISDLFETLLDVQKAIKNITRLCDDKTRIIISNFNYLWEPALKAGELFGLNSKKPLRNWLSNYDLKNILGIEGFEVIKTERKLLFPKYIPVISTVLNGFFANLAIIEKLDFVNLLVVRKISRIKKDYSVSIVIPCRNEEGNIENALKRIPEFGTSQEIIFIEGYSKDNTYNEALRVKQKYQNKNILVMKQSGKGKSNAVREAFDASSGDVLMILDADLTTPPEDLPKFYDALSSGVGEFINGCRLIYPLEKQAMRFLNSVANKFFGILFSYLLGQKLKDTLCGTKVLLRKDYISIKNNRKYFGEFDPFGDFDLLFGASKLDLKITEIPVRYRSREYGETQISRFSHGWLLLKMSLFAAMKIKFIK